MRSRLSTSHASKALLSQIVRPSFSPILITILTHHLAVPRMFYSNNHKYYGCVEAPTDHCSWRQNGNMPKIESHRRIGNTWRGECSFDLREGTPLTSRRPSAVHTTASRCLISSIMSQSKGQRHWHFCRAVDMCFRIRRATVSI